MKIIRPTISTILLALWMMLSFGIAAVVYAVIDGHIGNEGWLELDRMLYGFSIPTGRSASITVYWSQIFVCLPVCILMAAPVVWLLQRHKRNKAEQAGPAYPPQGVGSADP